MGTTHTTWDGLPVSDERPYGATVVVYRRVAGRLELLLLHRAHHGADYERDWAWTPPAGARFPGEPVDACARRELREEAGLTLHVRPTPCGTPDWHVYLAEAPPTVNVDLSHDPEHDRYEWLPPSDAVARCQPTRVAEALDRAIALLQRSPSLRTPPDIPTTAPGVKAKSVSQEGGLGVPPRRAQAPREKTSPCMTCIRGSSTTTRVPRSQVDMGVPDRSLVAVLRRTSASNSTE